MSTVAHRALNSYIPAFILFIATFFQSILLVPLFLKYWGNEKYGIWLTLYAFVMLIRTLDAGHQNYIGNEFSKYYHIDKKQAAFILGSGVRMGLLLGLIEILIYLIVIFASVHKEVVGINLSTYDVKEGILSLLVLWLLTGCSGGLITRILYPAGKYSLTNYFALIIKILEIFATLICIWKNASINTLCVLIATVTLIYDFFQFRTIKKKMPEFYPWWKEGTLIDGIKNFSHSLVLTFNGFIEQFNTNGLILLVSRTMGLLYVPMFTTVRTAGNTFMQISNLTLNPLSPELVRYFVKGEKEKIKATIETNWFLTSLIINVPVIICLPFIEYLYVWWTKGKLLFDPLLFYSFLLSVAVITSGKSFVTILTSINSLRTVMIISVTRFVITYVLSWILLKHWGLAGLGIAVLIAEMVSSGFLPAFFVYRMLNEKVNFWGNKMRLLSIIQMIILAVALWINYNYHDLAKLLGLSVTLGITLVISCFQWNALHRDVKMKLKALIKSKKQRNEEAGSELTIV